MGLSCYRRHPESSGQALGAFAIKASQFDSQPDQAGHEHDQLKSGQEELFVQMSATLPIRKASGPWPETEIAICRHFWCPRLESNQPHELLRGLLSA